MASSGGGKKMWCVPAITDEFVDRREDILQLYARKLDPREPVVCLDERPVVLRENARPSLPMVPGNLTRPITTTCAAGRQTFSASSSLSPDTQSARSKIAEADLARIRTWEYAMS